MATTRNRERLPNAVWILSAITFLTTMGFGVIGPALPALAGLFNISATAASIAISGFAAFRLLANVGFGGFLKRFRLRSVLVCGLALQAVSSFIAGFAVDGTMFLVFRSIGGLGSAALTVSATALLLALVPAHLRGRGMSAFFGASALGAISGPAAGGFLAIANPRLPLIFYGALLACASLISLFALRKARDVRTSDSKGADGAVVRARSVGRALMSNPVFIAALACHFAVGWALYGVRTTTVPLYLGALGYATGIIGVLMTVGAITQVVGSAASGSASDRWGRGLPLLFGIGSGAVALLIVALTGDLTMMMVSFVLMGLAGGALAAVPAAMLGDVPYGDSGLGVALYWIVFDVGAIVGPLVSGMLADSVGFEWALAAAQIPFVLAIVSSVYALSWRGRPATA